MLSEIEHLQSILADIIKQTISPSTLPLAGEDLVRDFRLSDHPDDQVMRRPYNNLKNHFVVCHLSLFTLVQALNKKLFSEQKNCSTVGKKGEFSCLNVVKEDPRDEVVVASSFNHSVKGNGYEASIFGLDRARATIEGKMCWSN